MSMEVYHQYEANMRHWASTLSWWHSVLYCHAVCVRAAPLYFAFTAREQWGDDWCIHNAQQLSAGFLCGEFPSLAVIDAAYAGLESVIPDSETFPDSASGCDAGIIHLHTLSLLRRQDPQDIYFVASYCYDIVDAAAGDDLLPAGILTPAVEAAIGKHRFVQAEVAWQAAVRDFLTEIPERDLVSARQFLDRWAAEPIIR